MGRRADGLREEARRVQPSLGQALLARRLRAVAEMRYEVHGQPSVGHANARRERKMSPYMRRNGGPTSGQGLADPEYVDLQFVVGQQV